MQPTPDSTILAQPLTLTRYPMHIATPPALIAVAAFALLASQASADDNFSQLPEDGAWAKFFVEVSGTDNPGLRVELTISSIGRTQQNGKDCRWIELVSNNADTNKRINAFKLLVPEEELKKGPFGPGDVVKSWVLDEGATDARAGEDVSLHAVGILFPDSLDDRKRPEEKEAVQWQKGRLDCTVLTGRSRARLGDQNMLIDHRYLLNEKTPFGLGGFRSDVKLGDSGNELKVEGKLLDIGTGAQSVIPNL